MSVLGEPIEIGALQPIDGRNRGIVELEDFVEITRLDESYICHPDSESDRTRDPDDMAESDQKGVGDHVDERRAIVCQCRGDGFVELVE